MNRNIDIDNSQKIILPKINCRSSVFNLINQKY